MNSQKDGAERLMTSKPQVDGEALDRDAGLTHNSCGSL